MSLCHLAILQWLNNSTSNWNDYLRDFLKIAINESKIATIDTIHNAIVLPLVVDDWSLCEPLGFAPFFTVVIGAGCSLSSFPSHLTTSPLSYVWTAFHLKLPSLSGLAATIGNSINSFGPIPFPVAFHVTFVMFPFLLLNS